MKNRHQEQPQLINLNYLKESIDKLDESVDALRAVYSDLDGLYNEKHPITNAPEKREKVLHL